jgi:hypothetical protein
MARYEREGKHYDIAVLTHLVEKGEATFYDGPGIYVIKTEDGTVAVRPHQVISMPVSVTLTDVVEITALPAEETTGTPIKPVGQSRSRGWISRDEEKELLNYFGI